MTFQGSFPLVPERRGTQTAPQRLKWTDLSLIIPVRNNPQGIRRLLNACLDIFTPQACPREIILVDNMSDPPLELPHQVVWGLPVRVLTCSRPGPAAARNLGVSQSTGSWLLFLDADCIPTPALLPGYQQAMNGSIAYAGVVRPVFDDTLSRYYESQMILKPPALVDQDPEHPAYLITANTLVWRSAFTQIGGFDEEHFFFAGGEDIDLGLRIQSVGPLAYAPEALVLHEFEADLSDFLRRFVRYGYANRLLSDLYGVDLTPHAFSPKRSSMVNRMLAWLQYLAMRWGYVTTSLTQHVLSASGCPILSAEPGRGETVRNMHSNPSSEIAVLIDGDNISPRNMDTILHIAESWGPIGTCRVYHNRISSKWDQICQQHKIALIQVGDAIVDIILAMDAEALLHTTDIRRFCLVTNDGDFATIAQRLAQKGEVFGIGAAYAAVGFKRACARFKILED